MQEMVELRSEYAKHFLAEDGKRVAELYTYPVHYLDRDTQAWEDSTYLIELDETVSGFIRNMKAAPFRVRFGADRVRFGFAAGKYITYQFQNANVITPAFEDHKATFAGLYSRTDVVYSILSKELKQEIVLLDATAPDFFNVLLEGNVTAELVDNAIMFMDGETVVGGIPAPYMTDAEGNRGEVVFALTDDILTITPDTDWLAAAVYPVTIDPTTTIQPDATAGKDAYGYETNPDTNYGTDVYLVAGRGYSAGPRFRSLIQFDLSSVIGVVTDAKLKLYTSEAEFTSASMNIAAHEVQASWGELTATWNTLPTYNATPEDTTAVVGVHVWSEWDITEIAEKWRNGTTSNYGLLLIGNEASPTTGKYFYSSDYTTDATLRPKLVVAYTLAAPTISAPASTDEGSPTSYSNEITPQATWSVNGIYTQKAAQIQVYDSNNNLVYDSGTIAGAGTTHNVATGYLKYGEIYGVRVRCQDNATDYWSEWSSPQYLQCVMTAPAGLSATEDATHAEIDLAWTAHVGENLAGYRIYRKRGLNSLSKNQSSIETDTTGFTTDGAAIIARDTSQHWNGNSCLKLTTVNLYDGCRTSIASVSATAGSLYTGSIYVKGTTGNETCSLSIQFFDASLNYLGQKYTTFSLTTSWQRVIVSYTAPTNSAYVSLRFESVDVGSSIYIDGLQIEIGSVASEWEEGVDDYEILKNLITTNYYSDRIPSSGVTYDYKVAAVATDGYVGPQSSATQTSVTVSATWIDGVQVPLRSIPVISTPRRASNRIATDGSYITQDLGVLPRTATFVIAYGTKALRDTYLAMFTAGHIFDYRGPDGETFRGKVISPITESRFNLPPTQFVGDLSFEAVEVD